MSGPCGSRHSAGDIEERGERSRCHRIPVRPSRRRVPQTPNGRWSTVKSQLFLFPGRTPANWEYGKPAQRRRWYEFDNLFVGSRLLQAPGPYAVLLARLSRTREVQLTEDSSAMTDKFDDEDYPAYTMGRAAEMLGVSQAFLRSVESAKLFVALRSEGGHRRYSRYQLRLAARVREITNQGTPVEAACRIVVLEDQLRDAIALNERYEQDSRSPDRSGPR